MRDAYPEMMESIQRVARVVKDEEHRYATTFQVAEKVFHDEAKIAGGRRAARRGCVQAVRHLRPGARRTGRDGARARPDASIARAFKPRWRSSGRARARAGRARTRRRSIRFIRALPKTEFVGRETLESPATVVAVLGWRRSCSIARRSTPKPADRWAIRACWFRAGDRRYGGDRRIRAICRRARTTPCTKSKSSAPIEVGRHGDRARRSGSALRHHAQSHRHASAARRAAQRCSERM